MAKYKAAGTRRPKTSARSAIPCLVILAIGFVIVFFVFYLSMQSGVTPSPSGAKQPGTSQPETKPPAK
jgi:hypothetical protein